MMNLEQKNTGSQQFIPKPQVSELQAQKPNKVKVEVEAYNSRPFDEPCPLEDFSYNIINPVLLPQDQLPNKTDNIQIMEDKIKNYAQNYKWGMEKTPNPNTFPSPDIQNEINNLNDELKKYSYEHNILNNTNNTKADNSQKSNGVNLANNIKNKNIIIEENTNEVVGTATNNILNPLMQLFTNTNDEDTNDLKNFIYSEMLNNISSQLNDSRIEKTIQTLNSLMNKDEGCEMDDDKNSLSSSNSSSGSNSSSETSDEVFENDSE